MTIFLEICSPIFHIFAVLFIELNFCKQNKIKFATISKNQLNYMI